MDFETAKGYLDRLGAEYILDSECRGEPGNGRERVNLAIRPVRVDYRLPNGYEFTGPAEPLP